MIPFLLETEQQFAVSTATLTTERVSCFKSDHLLLLLCLEGEAKAEVNLWPIAMKSGVQIMVQPGNLLQIDKPETPLRLRCIVCRGSIYHELSRCIEPSFFQFIRETPSVELPADEVDWFIRMGDMLELVQADTQNRYRMQMAANYLQNICFYIYHKTQTHFQANDTKWVSRKEELFKQFIHLVHQYCATEREVSFYAQQLHITPRYLSTVVLTVSGETTKDIIDRHTITEIKMRLKNTQYNIQEISNSMKFADQSFFGRYFKKHTGMSPLKYRNEM
ncbi:MAG: helix-turn-helix domain-containing protein [Bacteroides sp.]